MLVQVLLSPAKFSGELVPKSLGIPWNGILTSWTSEREKYRIRISCSNEKEKGLELQSLAGRKAWEESDCVLAYQVRGMECIRRLLRRSGEALRLLQLLQHHHVSRLAQSLGAPTRQQLSQLTFHQLVCSQEGEQIATRLVAGLMEVSFAHYALYGFCLLCLNGGVW